MDRRVSEFEAKKCAERPVTFKLEPADLLPLIDSVNETNGYLRSIASSLMTIGFNELLPALTEFGTPAPTTRPAIIVDSTELKHIATAIEKWQAGCTAPIIPHSTTAPDPNVAGHAGETPPPYPCYRWLLAVALIATMLMFMIKSSKRGILKQWLQKASAKVAKKFISKRLHAPEETDHVAAISSNPPIPPVPPEADDKGKPSPREATATIKHLFETTRRIIEHEDTLITARVSWFLQLQGFLFATFSVALGAIATYSAGGPLASNATFLPMAEHVQGVICCLGMLSSAIAQLGVTAAHFAIVQRKKSYEATIKDPRYKAANKDCLPHLLSDSLWVTLGLSPSSLLPPLCVACWAWLAWHESGNLSLPRHVGTILIVVVPALTLGTYVWTLCANWSLKTFTALIVIVVITVLCFEHSNLFDVGVGIANRCLPMTIPKLRASGLQ